MINSATKQSTLVLPRDGSLRGACHRARIRATRWLAMTEISRLSFRGTRSVSPESRDSPMRNCASEVWSFGPSRNDGACVEAGLPPHQPVGEIADGLAIDRGPIPFAHRLEVRGA